MSQKFSMVPKNEGILDEIDDIETLVEISENLDLKVLPNDRQLKKIQKFFDNRQKDLTWDDIS